MGRTVSYKGYADATRRFDIEPSPGRQRNRFNYLYRRLTTFNAGKLIPFCVIPCLPGDDFHISPRMLVRLSNPLVAPLMDEIYVNVYFFKTYNRFVFEDWNAFMGEHIQSDPDYDESGENNGGAALIEPPFNSPMQYELPTLTLKSNGSEPAFPIQSLYDYMALPYNVGNDGYEIQTLPLRHYNHIYNEYFRNENLQQFAPVPKSMGPDKITQYQLMDVTKYQDYFTGSLPFLQKGPNVTIGLTGDVPVVGNDLAATYTDGVAEYALCSSNYNNFFPFTGNSKIVNSPIGTSPVTGGSVASSKAMNLSSDPSKSNHIALLDQAQAVTLAQIRMAFQLQRFYEGQARSGTRYIEYIHFMFDEYIPDLQLQRPEYLGGGKFSININPVAQTSNNSSEVTPLGTLAAFGVHYTGPLTSIRTHCNEHGYILGLMCVRTNLTYQQGLRRDWSYRDRFDFYTPTLAHLAEQAVLNKELCTTGIPEYDNGVFGYIGRYDEYRTMMAEVTAYFRTNAPSSLHAYHLGEFFDVSNPGTAADNFPGLPHLNPAFIKQPKNVIDRCLNITSDAPNVPQFLADISLGIRAVRVVSKYGIPGFADHF